MVLTPARRSYAVPQKTDFQEANAVCGFFASGYEGDLPLWRWRVHLGHLVVVVATGHES